MTQKRLAARVRKNNKRLQYDVLVEEIVDNYAIGRAWFQAPEVDGNIVIQLEADDKKAAAIKPGAVVKVRAIAVSGVDIYAELIRPCCRTQDLNS